MAGGDEKLAIGFPDDLKGAPEPGAGDFGEATAEGQPITEFGGAFVIDLDADDHGELAGFRHGIEVHAHECGEPGAAGLDHAQVGEIVDDPAAVGVEKHDFFAGFEVGSGAWHGRSLGQNHKSRNVGLQRGLGKITVLETMCVRRLTIWLGMLGLLWGGGRLLAAPFVPPAEGVVAFRRDRLPLDVDALQELSQQLGEVAKGQGGKTAADRRTVAQLVALALAVQPNNGEARKFSEQFAKGEQQAKGEPKHLAATCTRIWHTLTWLESPAAGADGQALAACLGDVMAVADPKHPRALELQKKGEHGAWANWVKPLEAFQDPAPVAIRPPDEPPEEPPADKPESAPATIRLPKARVSTVLLTTVAKAGGNTAMRPLPILIEAKLQEPTDKDRPAKPPPPFFCYWNVEKPELIAGKPDPDAENFKKLSAGVKDAIEAEHGPLPIGGQAAFAPGGSLSYAFDKDRSALSGALAVLLDAAVTGTEPQATVIGEIQPDGSFQLPPRFWERLRALANGAGGRLVLPAEAASFLPSILAFEEPGFFLKYEVLLAANLKELTERSAKAPTGALADVTSRFGAIAAAVGTQAVPPYVANRNVRQRLEEIAQTAPFHGSARMLAVQAAGKRPVTLPPSILATELLMAIQPLASIPKEQTDRLDAESLIEAHDTCKKGVARLERYAARSDRKLLDLANDLVVAVRTLSRALRTKVDANGSKVSHEREFNDFKQSYERITGLLKIAVGNP